MIRIQEILDKVAAKNKDANLELIQKAYVFAAAAHAGQTRLSGEPYLSHPLAVADTLADMGFDEPTVAAGLLHDTVEDTSVTIDDIAENFGDEVADIVDGVTKISKIVFENKEEAQAENIRKMILAMSHDMRVIMVKLADRLHNMRTLDFQKAYKQKRIAQETMDIYAPLANRLGLYNIMRDLEDLSFKYLRPDVYSQITKWLEDHQVVEKKFIEKTVAMLKDLLASNGLTGEVYGRIKHKYSIYKKMLAESLTLDEMHDIMAFRVIVKDVKDCYAVLGLVHQQWKPVQGRFKDYISMPKANGYQSLHTTVIGREAIPFEVQIRTREMDRNAEYGIAAHWKYKAGITAASSDRLDKRLAWVRQLLESQRSSIDATDLLSDIKSDLLPEEVFAFTPRGDVINLPAGATVIDFAYAIHSAVGNRMIGAKVNNRIVPIDHQVVTGEIIEIITGPENRGPSRDWLNIVKTSEAKNKIRNWFKKERRDENIAEGKDAFEKELRRNLMVIPPEQYDEFMSNLARRNHCNSVDEMYAAIGYGGLQLARILPKLKEEYTRLKATEPKPLPTVDIKRVHSSDGVVVEGIDNCPIKFAKCCSPLPGDDIIGFVTRGFGVSIHKRDCANVQQSMKDPENAARWMKAYWADDAKEDYKATLELDCMDRANLLSDVALALGDMRVPIYSLSARAADQGRARMSLTVGIMNTVHLNNVVARLKKVKDVLTVTRN